MRFTKLRTILTFALLLCVLMQRPFSSHALNDGNFAHNIYSNPVLTGTSRGFDTFTIDFKASETPKATYWALCNWSMDINDSKSLYPGIQSAGAYAGLQNAWLKNSYKPVAIMSFWEWSYNNGEIMRAERFYPVGEDSTFGGEGEGTNWKAGYPWEGDTWYRMVIHCWTDEETGRTFVGQWFQDRSTGEWTLISYFNTHLLNSFFTGAMSQFMENFVTSYADSERDFNYKNMYVLDHKDQKWKSLNSSRLSFDHYNTYKNKRGMHEFGATEEYFWGKTSGILPDGWDSTLEYDNASKNNVTFTITQPDQPTFGDPALDGVAIIQTENGWDVSWTVEDTDTPQLSYKVELIDKKGNVVSTGSGTRPEVRSCSLDPTSTDALLCRVTLTDIFGQTATAETVTDTYYAAPGDINDNGKFDIQDVTLLLNILRTQNGSTVTALADVNGDGIVTAKDVSRLLQKIEEN